MATKFKETQPFTPGTVQGRDLFQTPNYATRLLVDYIPHTVDNILEPACGNGKIVRVLESAGYIVYGTDIVKIDGRVQSNFLTEEVDMYHEGIDCIITNPPFSAKRAFYERCRYYGLPFALLIPADYCGWVIRAVQEGCEKIIPTRRVDYITPTLREGTTSNFHSMWLTWGFMRGQTETFVELTSEMKKDI